MTPDVADPGSRAAVLPSMRVILVTGAVLTAVAGAQLFVLTSHTDRWFAWTIDAPLSAAIIGAFYLGACLLAGWNGRRRAWSEARIGIASVQLFLWATGIASLAHLSAFHLDSDLATAQGAAWVWLVVYVVWPPLVTIVYIRQVRAARRIEAAPPAHGQLPQALRALFAVVGVATLVAGALLVLAPEAADRVWAWDLAPLVSRATGAWLLAFGGLQLETAVDADPVAVRPGLGTQIVIGVLCLLAFARWPDDLRLGSAAAWAVIAWCAIVITLAVWAWAVDRRGPAHA